eukprot:15185-Heterococcus_DN1.PRE.4
MQRAMLLKLSDEASTASPLTVSFHNGRAPTELRFPPFDALESVLSHCAGQDANYIDSTLVQCQPCYNSDRAEQPSMHCIAVNIHFLAIKARDPYWSQVSSLLTGSFECRKTRRSVGQHGSPDKDRALLLLAERRQLRAPECRDGKSHRAYPPSCTCGARVPIS